MKNFKIKTAMVLTLTALSLCSCSQSNAVKASSDTIESVVQVAESTPPPGVVNYIWEEPMVDVIDVPPGLDPEAHYWRPGHAEVVEIRQGKWKHYRFPDQQK